MYIHSKKKKNMKKKCSDVFVYSFFLYRMLISTFECYLLGVFIIGDLCEIFFFFFFFVRVFTPWVTFVIYFEC